MHVTTELGSVGPTPRRVVNFYPYEWQDWSRKFPNNIRNGAIALCNDGSLWRIQQEPNTTASQEMIWKRLPDLPQD